MEVLPALGIGNDDDGNNATIEAEAEAKGTAAITTEVRPTD